jgi:hypothetical protein
MHDIAREQEARVAEHQAEQPDNPAGAGIVGEVDDEAGKIDLCLNTWRCLEAHLVGLGGILWTDRGEIALHRGIGADIAELADLAGQPRGAQVRKGGHALAQEIQIGRQLARPSRATRPIRRSLDAALDVFADGLWVTPRASGNGGDRNALAMQFQDHHQLSKSNHRRLPARGTWRRWRLDHSARASPDRMFRKERQSGNFRSPSPGRIAGPVTRG